MTKPTTHGRRAPSLPVLLTALALLAVALLALGCSSSSSGGYGVTAPSATTPTTAVTGGSTGAPTSGSATAGPKVDISNFSFNPATLTVRVGDTVTWTNNDSATHTVTFNIASLAPGASFSHTFSTAGTYPYRCTIHPNMTGTIIVQ
jgi:plastocyanin